MRPKEHKIGTHAVFHSVEDPKWNRRICVVLRHSCPYAVDGAKAHIIQFQECINGKHQTVHFPVHPDDLVPVDTDGNPTV